MPAITWRDVSAPNFSPATDALRTASGLFSNAFSGLSDSIQKVETRKSDLASKELEMAKLRYSDPEAYQAALASGEIYDGIDKRYVGAESIAGLGEWTGNLLDNKEQGVRIETGEFDLAESRGTAERDAAFAPIIAKAASMGDEEAALKYLTEEGAKRNMRGSEIQDAITSALGWAKDRSGLATDRLDRTVKTDENARASDRHEWAEEQHGWNRWGHQTDKISYEEERKAQEIIAEITAGSDSPAVALQNLNGREDVTGNVYNLVRSGLGLGGPGAVSGTGVSGSGGVTSGKFEDMISRLWETEGGYANDPDDPGGETMYGITIKTARANGYKGPMKDLPRSLAEKIYREKYFKPVEAAGVPAFAREAVFDFAVNAGPKRALEFWEWADGDINEFNRLRMEHYKDQPGWAKYGRGWENRVRRTTPTMPYSDGEARIVNAAQEEIERGKAQALRDPTLTFYADPKNRSYGGDSKNLVKQIRNSSWSSTIEGMSDDAVAGALDRIVSMADELDIPMTAAQAAGILRSKGVIRSGKLVDYLPGSGVVSSDLSLGGGKVLETTKVREQLERLAGGRHVNVAGEIERLRVNRDQRANARKAVQRAEAALANARGQGIRNGPRLRQLEQALEEAARYEKAVSLRD